MRRQAPFQPADLAALDERLFCASTQIVSMREVADGVTDPLMIGLRHDCDNVIAPAVRMAEWEAERGYRSTYFVLHTAPYWRDETLLRTSLERIAELGHEIGIHNNALTVLVQDGRSPGRVLAEAVEQLRSYGFDISGTVAHGDSECYAPDGSVRFVNDELFEECQRDTQAWASLMFTPISLADLGLVYDANWLPRGKYLSDSGGHWSRPGFDEVAAGFPYAGQLHVLVHPDWWAEAFTAEAVAA